MSLSWVCFPLYPFIGGLKSSEVMSGNKIGVKWRNVELFFAKRGKSASNMKQSKMEISASMMERRKYIYR